MKYITKPNNGTNEDIINEIRTNLLMINNKYSEVKMKQESEEAIDLMNFCQTEDTEKRKMLMPFVGIALEVEGIMEQDVSEETINKRLLEIVSLLQHQMEKV